MTQLVLQPGNWLRRNWLLASVLFILIFASHNVALAGDLHSFENDVTAKVLSGLSASVGQAVPTNAPNPPCDPDHDVRSTPGQNRLESPDIAGTSECLAASFAGASTAELFSVPPLFGTLLRTLLQVYLN